MPKIETPPVSNVLLTKSIYDAIKEEFNTTKAIPKHYVVNEDLREPYLMGLAVALQIVGGYYKLESEAAKTAHASNGKQA